MAAALPDTITPGVPARPVWTRMGIGTGAVAVAQRDALGTTARLAVWPPGRLGRVIGAVDAELARLDEQASRFREDSEISGIHRVGGGTFPLSEGLAEAIAVALAAARWTGGLTDPTVGDALIALGYDRDFAAIGPGLDAPLAAPSRAPGWRSVRLDGRVLRLPAGVRLDLGATAKGLGADRAARAALAASSPAGGMPAGPAGPGGGVLVSLGGDIAVVGQAPAGGWPVLVADDAGTGPGPPVQLVRLTGGALATSSVGVRRWRRAGRRLHHIVDPRTGLPAAGPWRTVSVAAATCAEANAAATAAIVAGERATAWLATAGLPARLVAGDGTVRLTGGWPPVGGGRLAVPPPGPLAAGFGPAPRGEPGLKAPRNHGIGRGWR